MTEIRRYKKDFKQLSAKESRRCKIYSLRAKESLNVIKKLHQELTDQVDTHGFNNPKVIKKLHDFIDHSVTQFKNQIDCQEEETANEILTLAYDVLRNTFTADFPELQFKIHSCAANLENALGHNEASLDYLKQALRHAEEYEKTTRNYIGLNSAQTYLNVANALFYLARFQEAFTYAEQADEAANRAIAQLKEIQTSVNLARFDEMDPEDVEANIIIRLDLQIMSWLLQGKTLEKLNMFDRSAMCLRNGKQILVENFGPQHPLNADFEEVLAIVEKQLELEKEIYNIDEALLEQNALLGEPIHNTYTRSALMQKGRILSYREEESETVLQPAKTLEELRAEYEAGLEKKEDDHNCRRRLKVLIQKRQMIDQQYQFEEMMLMTQPIQIPQHLPMQHQQPYETRESTIDAQRTITTAEKVERHIDDDAFSPQEQLQRVSIVDPELIVNPIPLSDEWATETIEFTTQQKIYGVTVFEEKFNPDDNLEYEGIPSKNLREKSQFSKVLKVITEDHEMFKSLHKQSHSEIIKLNPDTPGSTFVEDQSKPEAYRKHIWQIVHDMVKDTDTTNQTISDEELKLIIEWEARQIITADEYGDNSREIVYITDSMEPKTDPKIITLNHLLPPERVYKTKLVKMNLKALAKIQAYVRGFCVRSAMRKFEWVLISDWLFKDQAKEQYFFVKVFRNNGVAINANYKVVVSSKRFIDNWRTRMFESLPCLDQEVQVYFKKALTIVYDKKEEFFMEDFNIATLPKATVVEKLPVKKSGMGEIQIGEIDFITGFKEPPTGFRGTIEIKRFRLLDKWTVALSFVAQMTGKEEKGETKKDKKEKKGKESKEKGKKDKTKEKKDKAPKDKKDKKDKKPKDKKDKSKSKDKKKDPQAEKSNVTITRFFRVDVSFFHAASRQTTADYINLKQLPTQLRYMALYLRDHLHVYMNEGDTAINYASLGSSRSKMPFEEMIATLERDFVEKEEPVQKVKEAVNEAIVDIMHAANDEFGKFEIMREGVEFIVQVRFIKSLKMPWRIFVFQKTNLNNSDFVQLTHLQERGKDLEKFLRQKLCIYFDPVTKLIDYVCLASLKHLQKPPLVHFMVYHKKRWFSLLLEQNDDDPQEPYRLSVMADKSNETAAHKKLRNIATQNKRILCALYGDNILLSSHKNAQDYPETVINYKSEFGKVAEEEVSLNTFVMEQENLTYSVEVIKKKHAVNSWTIVVQQVDSVSFGMVVLDELEVLQYEREAYLRQHLQIRLNANKTIKYVRLNYPVERKEIAVDAPKDKMDGIPDWVIHKLQLRGLQIRLKKLKAEREKGLICRFKIFKENKRDVDVLIEVRQGEALETKKDREIRKKQQIIMNERDGKIEEDIEESQEVANEKFETKTVILFQIKAINQRNLNNIQTKLIRESEMQLPIRSCLLDYLRVAIKLQWDSNLTRVERIDFNQQDTFVTDVIQFRSSLNMNTFLNNLGKSDLTLPSWLQICARHDKNEKMFYSLWIDADLRTDQTHCQVNIFHVNPRDVRDKQVKDAPITFKLREVYDLFYPHHVGENIPYLQQVSFLEIGRFYHAWKEFLSFFNVKHTGHFDRQGFIEHRKKYFKVLEANKNKMIDGFTIAGVVENAEYEKGFIYFIISCPQAETFKFSLRTEDDDKDFEHIELKSFTSEQLEHARNQPVDSMIKGFELLLQQKLEAEMTRAAQETNNSYNRVKKIVERLKKDLC